MLSDLNLGTCFLFYRVLVTSAKRLDISAPVFLSAVGGWGPVFSCFENKLHQERPYHTEQSVNVSLVRSLPLLPECIRAQLTQQLSRAAFVLGEGE